MKPRIARYKDGNRTIVREYPGPSAPDTDVILAGDWVTLTSGRVAKISGADPATLLGIAKSHNQHKPRKEAIDRTKILVEVFNENAVVVMEGSSAPVIGDVGADYGIVTNAAGDWIVDKTETTNKRVHVEQVDLVNNLFYCTVLAAVRAV